MTQKSKVIYGIATVLSETGSDGDQWAVYDERVGGYEGLYAIKDGDYLKVEDDGGATLFEGIIKKKSAYGFGGTIHDPETDRNIDWTPAGLMGSWTQEGWDKNEWAELFYRKRKAKLIQKQK